MYAPIRVEHYKVEDGNFDLRLDSRGIDPKEFSALQSALLAYCVDVSAVLNGDRHNPRVARFSVITEGQRLSDVVYRIKEQDMVPGEFKETATGYAYNFCGDGKYAEIKLMP